MSAEPALNDGGNAVNITIRAHRDLEVLLEKLRPGEVAVINRLDLDAVTARRLIARQPFAVLNQAEFVSGRYPNLGPQLLLEAGIQLWQLPDGAQLAVSNGATAQWHSGALYQGSKHLVDIENIGVVELRAKLAASQAGLTVQLESFVRTATLLLQQEQHMFLDEAGLPPLNQWWRGSPAVVVLPTGTQQQFDSLNRFIRQQTPAIIAADSGAELLGRRRIDVLVTDITAPFDAKAVKKAKEVVIVGTGSLDEKYHRFNKKLHQVDTTLTAAQVAVLLAHHGGASYVIPVGAPADLAEFIDRDRSDQAATFLTRLKLGSQWVDPASVPLLYTGVVRRWQVGAVVVLALIVLVVALNLTPVGREWTLQGWDFLSRVMPQ